MSLEAMTWALNAEASGEMPVECRLLLATMADFADSENRAWPSSSTLSKRTGSSTRTVKRNIQKLIELQLISLDDQRMTLYLRGDRRPNVYRLEVRGATHDTSSRGDTYVTPLEPHGVTPVTSAEVVRGDTGGRHGVTRVSPEPTTKPTTTPSSPPASDADASVDGQTEIPIDVPAAAKAQGRKGRQKQLLERFDEFWDLQEKKVSKPDARIAWCNALEGKGKHEIDGPTDPQTIINGWKLQMPKWQRHERQYIPNPASWLNGRRWEDEVNEIAPTEQSAWDIFSNQPIPQYDQT